MVSLYHAAESGIAKLPFSIRILLENALRNFDGRLVTPTHIDAFLDWEHLQGKVEIPFMPARILMQDFTGVPAVVDIASLRSEMVRRGESARDMQPKIPVDVIIDHSVQVDSFGTDRAIEKNVELEYERNAERYRLLKWASKVFNDFSVLPPGMGICHQVNLEYLTQVVTAKEGLLFPDSLVGTDSHTPMVNGLGVLGWGVGGIEAEAAMLGRPLYFTLPEVVGVRLTGTLPAGITTTDLVLAVTERLRREHVVGSFVEFYGDGVERLSVPDRATIANMSPEFGCTVSYFPVDRRTIEYLGSTGRDENQIDTVERYLRANYLWNGDGAAEAEGGCEGEVSNTENRIIFSRTIEIDLSGIQPAVAGPRRPQDRIPLVRLKEEAVRMLSGDAEDGQDGRGTKVAREPASTTPTASFSEIPEESLSRRPEDEGLQFVREEERGRSTGCDESGDFRNLPGCASVPLSDGSVVI
ncbi:MAG: aconitase family protein, partial [Sediminispirochaetaceae bacterium]